MSGVGCGPRGHPSVGQPKIGSSHNTTPPGKEQGHPLSSPDGVHSNRRRDRLQAYSSDFSEIAGCKGDRGCWRAEVRGRLGGESVAVPDQEQEETAEQHGPERDSQEDDEDVALGGRNVDAPGSAAGRSGASGGRLSRGGGSWTRQCRPPESSCLGRYCQ